MDVHWGHKRMSFEYHGKKITLSGIQPQTNECPPVSLDQLHFLVACNGIHQMVQLQAVDDQQKGQHETEMPPPIANLVKEFQDLTWRFCVDYR